MLKATDPKMIVTGRLYHPVLEGVYHRHARAVPRPSSSVTMKSHASDACSEINYANGFQWIVP